MYSYSTINHSPLFSSLPSLKTQINLLQSRYPTLALLCLRCVSVSALGWRLIDRTEPLACSYYGNHPNKMLLHLRRVLGHSSSPPTPMQSRHILCQEGLSPLPPSSSIWEGLATCTKPTGAETLIHEPGMPPVQSSGREFVGIKCQGILPGPDSLLVLRRGTQKELGLE